MKRILLENINIFNPEDSSIKHNQNILIENDFIKSISSVPEIDVEKIDCSGKYAIAGMFECHAHLAYLTSTNRKLQNEILGQNAEKKQKWNDFVSIQLKGFLKRGITQVRDVGGPIDNLNELNNKILNNQLAGPEIFYSGPMLEGSPLTWKKSNLSLPGFTVAIDTTEDLKMLDDLKSKGASLIKTFGKFDKDVYKKLLKKAKSLNLPVTHDPGAPLYNSIPMDYAISEGITCIEHAKAPLPCILIPALQSRHDSLVDEIIALRKTNPQFKLSKKMKLEAQSIFLQICKLKEQVICEEKLADLIKKTLAEDFYFCPTLNVWETFLDEFNSKNPFKKILFFFMRKKIDFMKLIKLLNNIFIKKMVKAGTKILVGQDGHSPENTYKEMKLLYEAGLSIAEIIKGATIYPARWLKVDHLYGSISPLKKANICILNSNPLLSLENINDIFMVFKKGNIVYKKYS